MAAEPTETGNDSKDVLREQIETDPALDVIITLIAEIV